MFITFEGGEGSGKSTVIKHIVSELEKEGYQVVLTREPGGTPISEEIRNIILDKKNTMMDPKTEALLYAASRRQHIVEKILPALKEGKVVLCDRFLDSSLAYQGGARGLGIKEVYEMNQFATDGLLPDLTILFDIAPEEGLKRIAANAGREVNRLDVEQLSFHKKVREAFHELAKEFPERYVVIDASKSVPEVSEEAYSAIKERMGK
ncbi:MAG: dTMP kinase [Bacilli bacterium]|jgi:dTMP kinase|nr:dTMP kinase [Bacilli bacterium]MCH4210160.1 dTMP kinase [Bacilli bacterium]MCH4229090.1 dTMP kinase [Bacilli bacterium]MCH4278258.1 dTMP kinase [Bacilli bacterium]MCI2055410.1 dTMP kinase [Bacilli bacterium]